VHLAAEMLAPEPRLVQPARAGAGEVFRHLRAPGSTGEAFRASNYLRVLSFGRDAGSAGFFDRDFLDRRSTATGIGEYRAG
jgi:hypothetical protein